LDILKTRPSEKRNLVQHSFGKNKIQAVHQVMSFGILSQIELVVEEFGADVRARMHNKLSTLHCAAQSYSGYLSILVLVQKYKLSPDIRDNFNATPLHFAIINKEFKNVELLIKLGANVNA
jgi:ankyrin repeat protein